MKGDSSDLKRGPVGVKSSVERLLKAIGYPERIPDGSSAYTLRVDGMEVVAEEANGRLVLSCALTDDDSLLPTLASYAAGRMLREDAVLAYGAVGLSTTQRRNDPTMQRSNDATEKRTDDTAFLWQSAPADADEHVLLRLFETFTDSCDWWRTRVNALRGGEADAASVPETMVIRP